MKKSELNKLTKKQLFELEDKLKALYAEIPLDDENFEKRDRLKYEIKTVRHKLYECRLCADANIVLKISPLNGEETEYFKGDCGDKECKYKDAFLRRAEAGEDKIKLSLKKLLELA